MTEAHNVDEPAPNADRRWRIAASAGIVLLTFIAYFPAIHAGLIWDDDYHIAKQSLHSLHGLKLIWTDPAATQQYYPLSHTSFWIQWALWGERPMGYHIVNIFLHALNAVLFWRVLLHLRVPGALLAAAIFAVHPVHVESVAWITELKNTLMGMFCLLSLLAYCRFNPPVTVDQHPLRWKWYAVATLLFIAAILSKASAASLPAAILVILWWKRGRLQLWRDIAPLTPWFAIGAAIGLTIMHFERVYWGSNPDNFASEFFNWTLRERTLVAGWAVWFYYGKLLWPHPLSFFYERWDIDAGDWQQYLWPIAALALLVVLWVLRKRIGRGPLAAALLFGGTLFPALGFFNLYWQIYSYIADHMQYLPSLSVFALVAGVLALISVRLPRWASVSAACGIIVILASLTWSQCHIYQNLESLYRDVIAKTNDSWLAHNNLAVEMHGQDRLDESERLYRRAIEIRPNYEAAIDGLATVLGSKSSQAAHQEAVGLLKRAIDLYAQQADSQRSVARRLRESGNDAEARWHDSAAKAITAKQANTVFNLGNQLVELKLTEEAAAAFLHAVELNPSFEEPLNNLGNLYRATGRDSDAVNAYLQAIAINPDNAAVRFNFGALLMQRGQSVQAVEHLRHAMQVNKAMTNRVKVLARSLAEQSRYAAAKQCFDLVLEVTPDDADTRADRDRAAYMSGQRP